MQGICLNCLGFWLRMIWFFFHFLVIAYQQNFIKRPLGLLQYNKKFVLYWTTEFCSLFHIELTNNYSIPFKSFPCAGIDYWIDNFSNFSDQNHVERFILETGTYNTLYTDAPNIELRSHYIQFKEGNVQLFAQPKLYYLPKHIRLQGRCTTETDISLEGHWFAPTPDHSPKSTWNSKTTKKKG